MESENNILDWINELLQINIKRFDDLKSGAVFCQLLDVYCGGKIDMLRVYWRVKYAYESVSNYQILEKSLKNSEIQISDETNFDAKIAQQGMSWIFDYNARERRGFMQEDLEWNTSEVFNLVGQNPAAMEDLVYQKHYEVNYFETPVPRKTKIDSAKTTFLQRTINEECQVLSTKLNDIKRIVFNYDDSDENIATKLRQFF